ncbi:tyrosine-type recombinase/integrase [Streptomyces kunmingensis]|uniref:Tyrosine-type recombinase/integrase n=1 Tax=Streptomyces kunmingensis TaxID=68225 RepID=A0ABU6C3G4_9ACTN|nr:tyrosine-type recombinase/integrase [Streptomyces kunmingensis]MEB3959258.1 tyrosine-type recombinase/integrase [Streptomyces kunmingensis]
MFQADCVQAFTATWAARGFALTTINAYNSLLPRVLAHFDRPVWQIEPVHEDAMLHMLLRAGRSAGTRRRYLDMLRAFHTFVRLRHGAEIRAVYGTTVAEPLDRFNRLRHVWDEPSRRLPPTAERLAAFFAHARARLATVSDYPAAARDYALLRTLYHSAPRLSEALRLELCDVHPDLGPSGKLHVRFGKAANASGPRPRWAPMLNGLDHILAWYQSDIRPLFPNTAALFCDALGQPLKPETVRDRLSRLLGTEDRSDDDRFTPHDLRRACATHHYEQGMDLTTVQQLLGHHHIASTMAYVRPCLTFVEDAWRRATSTALTG